MVKETILVLFFIQIFYELSNILYWLQVKEYRADRFLVFLKSADGKTKLNLLPNTILFSFFVFYSYSEYFELVVFIALLFKDIGFLYKVIKKKFRRPVITQRTSRIITVSVLGFLIPFVFYIFKLFDFQVFLVVSTILTPAFLALGNIWTQHISDKIKKLEVAKAKEKLANKELVVIGITGSYGKTSTKEFLSKLLSTKFITEKTTKNENTEFGVARKILNDFEDGAEVFVAEMGAYKKGEIKALSDLTSPQIGIITGVEPQHLDLFGSLENIKKAKFELIEELPQNSLALFNLNSPHVLEMYEKAKTLDTKLRVVGYKVISEDNKFDDNIYTAKIVSADEKGISFKILNDNVVISSPLHGVHFVQNLLASIKVAREMKIPWSEIKNSCEKLENFEKTMEVRSLSYGSILIDDSYNSTPSAFFAALDYLKYFKNKEKVVVTSGIIELGDRFEKIHEEVGRAMKSGVGSVLVTNKESARFIKKGLGTSASKVKVVENQYEIVSLLEKAMEKGSVILLEGRMSKIIYDFLNSRTKK